MQGRAVGFNKLLAFEVRADVRALVVGRGFSDARADPPLNTFAPRTIKLKLDHPPSRPRNTFPGLELTFCCLF